MNESKTSSDIYIGQLVNNRYLIRDLLGTGGMGRVYLAEDVTKECMLVAIKMLSMNIANKNLAERFGREIFIGAQLGRKSQHITRVFTYGITNEKVPFYVMEYLRGRTIKQILKNESLDLSRFFVICQQICLGLHCAHQGVTLNGKVYPIIHRDIKPENIFINNYGKKTEIVKILDFGIAKFFTESSGMTMTESFIGSLPYSSPEHMQGKRIIDIRSDIYSLGVLMFEMLTRRHPFYTTSHSFSTWCRLHCIQAPPTFEEVNPHVHIPQELQQLVMRCLAKDVNDRPKNVQEILDDLEKIKTLSEQTSFSNNNSRRESNTNVQLVPLTSFSEQECWQKKWPKNKPVGLICFPHLLHTIRGNIPTFWAMLPQAEIMKFKGKTHNTEFISKIEDYPMILWLTILSDESELIRWLSYYLDIKDNREEKILRTLAGIGYYHLLFFACEYPHKCSHVMTFMLTAKQRQHLSDVINISHNKKYENLISSTQAKSILKIEYEKLKVEVRKKTNTKTKKYQFFLPAWMTKIFDLFKS